jgi:hypothetical protein
LKDDKNDDFTQHTRLNARALAFNLQFRVNKMLELAHDFLVRAIRTERDRNLEPKERTPMVKKTVKRKVKKAPARTAAKKPAARKTARKTVTKTARKTVRKAARKPAKKARRAA